MSRRIEVELTSRREDGSFTWRAAGAKEPRGTVETSVLPDGASVGDVLRVDVETYLDGTVITALAPERAPRREPERLELVGSGQNEPLVTSTRVTRDRGEGRGRRRDGDDRGGRDDRGPRGERRGGPRDGRPGGPRDGRPGGPRDGRPGGPRERRSNLPERPKPKRLRAGKAHRNALVASLPEEQRPIAEELARGGVPGVRAALDAQNAQARTEGKPEINPAPLLAMAEDLWPKMRAAEWRDRADGALSDIDELDLRDLRSVVVAADSGARDDESRQLADTLREALARRVDAEQNQWLTDLAALVGDGRIVAALRRSSRPPKAGSPLPPELAELMIQKASEGMAADVADDRWAVMLDALSFSPVRTSAKPVSVPESPSDTLLEAVRRAAARLPHIAALFGIEPAPPGSGGGRRRGGGAPGPRRGGDRPVPPPPPRPDTDTAPAAEAATDAAPAPVADVPASTPAAPADDAVVAEDTAAAVETAPEVQAAEAASEVPAAAVEAAAEAPAAETAAAEPAAASVAETEGQAGDDAGSTG
ncbi:MAG: hypothetical protein OEY23_23975, partial [Acidimicrobiia bacterium]|nr:hypothetical protein [Acidimicrobiia bacterium]